MTRLALAIILIIASANALATVCIQVDKKKTETEIKRALWAEKLLTHPDTIKIDGVERTLAGTDEDKTYSTVTETRTATFTGSQQQEYVIKTGQLGEQLACSI